MALHVVSAGVATTFQDHGRPGHAATGVPRGGAVDRRAHDLVNRLVGNPPDSATLETAGGLVLEARAPVVVATSADGARHTLAAGTRITVTAPAGGMWGYLGVRGGFAVQPVLGSRSIDTLSGLGPPAPADGDVIPVGPDPGTAMPAEHAPPRAAPRAVRLWPGPRAEWFDGGVTALTGREWTVQADVSRVGVRLGVGTFTRAVDVGRMASEALVPGAIQVTPSGEPIVMLANHPTTGGYPVVAVVEPDDLGVVAQARPGSTLRFRNV